MRGYWQLNAVLFLQQKIPHLIHYLQYNIEKQHNHTSMHEYMTGAGLAVDYHKKKYTKYVKKLF